MYDGLSLFTSDEGNRSNECVRQGIISHLLFSYDTDLMSDLLFFTIHSVFDTPEGGIALLTKFRAVKVLPYYRRTR